MTHHGCFMLVASSGWSNSTQQLTTADDSSISETPTMQADAKKRLSRPRWSPPQKKNLPMPVTPRLLAMHGHAYITSIMLHLEIFQSCDLWSWVLLTWLLQCHQPNLSTKFRALFPCDKAVSWGLCEAVHHGVLHPHAGWAKHLRWDALIRLEPMTRSNKKNTKKY